MSNQIAFFNKAVSDFSYPNVSATASQGAAYAAYALNRSNQSAWITTGSVDADNTTWEVDFSDPKFITDIFLLKQNFKNFKIEYWNGSAYVAFATPLIETVNAAENLHYSFPQIETQKIKITIYGTMIANAEKVMYQFIATTAIGTLQGWPVIQNSKHKRNRKISSMLSGKSNIYENIGGFETELTVKEWRSAADLASVEALFNSSKGFLVWLCGGSETQFSSQRIGYRLEDIYLVKCSNDYSPNFVQGQYQRGLEIKIQLMEVVQ